MGPGRAGEPAPASGSEAGLGRQEVADGVGPARHAVERRGVHALGAGRLDVPQLALLVGVAAHAADVARLVDDLPLAVAVPGGHEVDLHRGVLVPLVAADLDGLGLGPARLLLGLPGLRPLGLQLGDPLAQLTASGEQAGDVRALDALDGLQGLVHGALGGAGLDQLAGDLVGVHVRFLSGGGGAVRTRSIHHAARKRISYSGSSSSPVRAVVHRNTTAARTVRTVQPLMSAPAHAAMNDSAPNRRTPTNDSAAST